MSTFSSVMEKDVATLTQHIELNHAGWRDKAVQRLVLAALWRLNCLAKSNDIRKLLREEMHLVLRSDQLESVLSELQQQNLILKAGLDTYRIPDIVKADLERDLTAAESDARNARSYFEALVTANGLKAAEAWETFEMKFLAPLIKEVGASAFRLLLGQRIVFPKQLVDDFLLFFETSQRDALRLVVTSFLEPTNPAVCAHIGRLIHAFFCVQACGLPQATIERLATVSNERAKLRLFVDTNILFSILDLHENPSNEAVHEMMDLLGNLPDNLEVELLITPKTVEEAVGAIRLAKEQWKAIPSTGNFARVGLRMGASGIVEKFLAESLKRPNTLKAADWFTPYITDFVEIVQSKGVSLVNRDLDPYGTRQDVVDDVNDLLELQKTRARSKLKGYQTIKHDVVLWHFVKDQRPVYAESPLQAQDWILTVDFRLLGFDDFKQRKLNTRFPLCLHPTGLIQLLRFWIPRTDAFDEAMLSSLRMPFLFRELDVEAERVSLKILDRVARFQGSSELSEDLIIRLLWNENLRQKIDGEISGGINEEIQLVREALIEESNAQLQAKESEANQLEIQLTAKEHQLRLAQQENERNSIASEQRDAAYLVSKNRTDALELELKTLTAQILQKEDNSRAAKIYSAFLLGLALLSGVVAWIMIRLVPIGFSNLRSFTWLALPTFLVLVFGHLLFEKWAKSKELALANLATFKLVTKARAKAWIVFLGLLTAICVDLLAELYKRDLGW